MDYDYLLFLTFISSAIFGMIGIQIAKNKNVSDQTGFLYGALLGPFGLIIVALLNPDSDRNTEILAFDEYSGERNVSDDAYSRLSVGRQDWLARQLRQARN